MTGYFGCVDMYVLKNFETLFEIFLGPSFTEYYLNSPVQSGLSATCYATVSQVRGTPYVTTSHPLLPITGVR